MATKEQQIINARYINQRLTLDKFEKTAVQEIQAFYTAARAGVLADINRAIARDYDISTQSRLFDLLDEVDSMIAGTQASLTNSVAGAAGHAGAFSYKDTNQILSWDGRNKNFNYVALSAGQIQALVKTEPLAGKNLGEWLWSALDAENGALRNDINAARVRGLGYDRILTSLGDRYDDLFDVDRARRDLETVTKSYIQATNAKAHSDIYSKNRDVMKGVEWSAIMENGNSKTGRGTCPRCQGLDGNTYKTEQEGPAMPLHARCRCMYLPLTLTWKELFGDDFDVEEMAEVERKWYERDPKTRRIMDTGRTGLNYGEWWETKPTNWQDNAIGPYRAGLVRNKSMQFSSIVDTKTGRLIPLDELVKKGIISQDELNLVRRSKKGGGGGGGGAPPAAAPKVAKVVKKGPLGDFNPYDITPDGLEGYRVAADLKDAEKIAADMGFTASYAGYDLVMADAFNRSYARMQQAFPILQGQELYVGTKDFVTKNFGKSYFAEKVASQDIKHIAFDLEDSADEWKKARNAYTDSPSGNKYFKKWESRNKEKVAAVKLLEKTPSPADIPETTLRKWYEDKLVGRWTSGFRGSTKAWGYTYNMADVPELKGNGGLLVLNKVAKQTSFEAQYRHSGKTGFHPPKTVEQWRTAVVTHELGHNVDFRLTASTQGTQWQKFLTDEVYKSGDYNIGVDVSGYALKNRRELVAEAIADVMDDEGGSPLSQKIVGKILELIAKVEK